MAITDGSNKQDWGLWIAYTCSSVYRDFLIAAFSKILGVNNNLTLVLNCFSLLGGGHGDLYTFELSTNPLSLQGVGVMLILNIGRIKVG